MNSEREASTLEHAGAFGGVWFSIDYISCQHLLICLFMAFAKGFENTSSQRLTLFISSLVPKTVFFNNTIRSTSLFYFMLNYGCISKYNI